MLIFMKRKLDGGFVCNEEGLVSEGLGPRMLGGEPGILTDSADFFLQASWVPQRGTL